MKYRNYLMPFIAIFTFTLMTEAKEIYESKNKQGEVEFTDQPSPGAQVVNIEEPNIADAVDSPKPIQDKPEIEKTTKQIDPVEPEVVYRGFADDDDRNPKRVHREQQIQERRYDHKEDQDGLRPKENRGNEQQKAQHKETAHHGARR